MVFLEMVPKEVPTLQRLFKPHVLKLPIYLLARLRRHVTWADLRRYGVITCCAACSEIAVHGKTTKLHGRVRDDGWTANGA